MKERRWYYLLPLAGTVFGIWYIRTASYDVVYSDYIRLVNSYLPDVWNPAKFFVPDVLTRVPLSYLGRIVNTALFHYSLSFDQVMGVLGLGLCGAVLAAYCVRREIGAGWVPVLMAVLFSLNQWEMLVNGSGWMHYFAYAGFYEHYLVLDRVVCGRPKPGDGRKLLWLPWLLILCVAGQYCAVYAAVLFAVYPFLIAGAAGRSDKRRMGEYISYLLSAAAAFAAYLLSNAFAVEEHAGMHDIPLFAQLTDTPMYFVRFLLKSLSSTVAGIGFAERHFTGNAPYLVLGLFVVAAYLTALWLQYSHRLYRETLLPLMLILSGGASHLLVLLARWSFLREDYGMSSRYALQFAAGVLGIILTYALAWKERRPAGRKSAWACVCGVVTVFITGVFLLGAAGTTVQEIRTAPYRKQLCMRRAEIALDFENRSDDELRENFEYRTSLPESGQAVRDALTILKENGWNVFYED